MERSAVGLKHRNKAATDAAVSLVVWGCRLANAFQRASSIIESLTEGLMSPGLDAGQRAEVTMRLYDRQPRIRTALFDWERTWFEALLPQPPARILVGGCGTGCEVRALLDRGYEVWAFDPSAAALNVCVRANPELSFAGCFSYEQLSASLLLPDAPQLLVTDVRFAAVLLGWGSFTHVLEESAQQDVLRALHRIAPEGPILASFFFASNPIQRGRAYRFGQRLAEYRLGSQFVGRPHERLLSHGGFVHFFDSQRLAALGAICGREVVLDRRGGYAHATFLPPTVSRRARRSSPARLTR